MAKRIDIMLAIIEAWKAKDIDAVLAHLDDDIVWHYAVAAERPLVGKAMARKFIERLGAGMHDVRWRIFAHMEAGDRLFVEGVDEFATAEGVTVATPYAGVLEFRGDRVVAWRDYVDVGVMTAQRAGEPMTPHVRALIDRPVVA